MPIYDYTCGRCGHLTEVIHGINEGGPKFCPNCGAEGTMRKGFTAPAVHFKGSGWARKDRSTGSSKSGTRPATSTESDGGSGSSETKPAAAGAPAASKTAGTDGGD